MRAWEIAKVLLKHCESEQEVDQVIETLNDTLALREVCVILSSFASRSPFNVPAKGPSGTSTVAVRKPKQSTIDHGVKPLPVTSRVVMAEQLEVVFRAYGMTNRQVEQWFTTNFKIDVPVGKGSLRRYLMRVLAGVDLGLANRILAMAQGGLTGDSLKRSDIEEYWDGLDKQFSDVP